ncbi:MAG TPA: MarR family winged helix-turn-helix transcriptional regulator [Candidatus Acidoferrum sp.]|nr:MarR family winged helix-turn-helix transcriptional regulator [Candidatus Acidoferrum sp.]
MNSRLDPQNSICCLISQLDHSLGQEITSSLDAVGLTCLQLQVLAELAKFPGMSTADLARSTCVTPQNMSLAVSKLARRQCLVRRPHPTNARIHQLDLTPQGRRVLGKGLDRAWAVEHRTFGVLGPRDRRKLLESLRASLAPFKTENGTSRMAKRRAARRPAYRRGSALPKAAS